MFSERSELSRSPNRLSRVLSERARPPRFDLTASNPTVVGLPYDRAALFDALHSGDVTTYEPHPLGHPSARAALSSTLSDEGVQVDPAALLLTSSTSELYAHLFHLLCDPGDDVLVPEPSYPLLAHLAHQTGVHLTPYPLVCDGCFRVDAEALYEAASDRTRAIVAVSPNNPTGNYLTADEHALLSSFGLPLLVDEVFHRYALDLELPPPRVAASPNGPLTFALDGLSKRALLPGMKLAWMTATGPAAEVEEALERLALAADTFLSPNTPVQLAVEPLLRVQDETARAANERCRANLASLRRTIEGSAVSVPTVEGGWYAPLRVPALRTDEDWAVALLEEADVLVHPGYFFDLSAEQAWLVVSLLAAPSTFEPGLEALVSLIGAG